jgi:hypothetical protein
MPAIDVVDETFITVPPATLARLFSDVDQCRRWWPDLTLAVYADRGDAGLRWTVTGALVGTMEVWLEAVLDGTVLHYFLRADAKPGVDPVKHALMRQFAAKRIALGLKAGVEKGRAPGLAPE